MAGTGASAASSTQHAKQVSTGSSRQKLVTRELHGKVRVAVVNVTVGASTGTGSGGAVVTTDEINLIILPASPIVLIPLCGIKFSASQGSGTHVDIGVRAYVGSADGVTVAEDTDGLIDGWDAATTTLERWPTSAGAIGDDADVLQRARYNSKDPITVLMKALNAGGTYDGDLADTYAFEIFYATD